MAKAKEVCTLCGAKIPAVSFCPRCGQPTRYISASERVMWELGQWQSSRNGSTPATNGATIGGGVSAPAAAAPVMEAPTPVAPARTRVARPVEVESTRIGGGAVVHKLRKHPGSRPTRAASPVAAAAAPAAAPQVSAPPTRETVVKQRVKPEKVKREKAPREKKQKVAPAPAEPVLKLQPGEAILGEVHGRSHLRPTTLYVTNFRVAETRPRNRVAWIPHEHIDEVQVKSKSVVLHSSIESIRVRAGAGEIAAAAELIERYMAAARRPGTRFDATLVQEWCDRSSDMWDSHTGRIRLWIRRHPVVTLSSLGGVLAVAKLIGP